MDKHFALAPRVEHRRSNFRFRLGKLADYFNLFFDIR